MQYHATYVVCVILYNKSCVLTGRDRVQDTGTTLVAASTGLSRRFDSPDQTFWSSSFNPNPQPQTPNPTPQTQNPKPEPQNPKPETKKPKTENQRSETQNPKPENPDPDPRARTPIPTSHTKTQNPKPQTPHHPTMKLEC